MQIGVNVSIGALRLVFFVGSLALASSGCGTSKSIQRVRQAPRMEGVSLIVRAQPSVVARELQALLRARGYEDVTQEPVEQDSLQVLGATPSTWRSFGHGVRILVEPVPPAASQLRMVFARRLTQNASEDLEQAREHLVDAIRARWGGET